MKGAGGVIEMMLALRRNLDISKGIFVEANTLLLLYNSR